MNGMGEVYRRNEGRRKRYERNKLMEEREHVNCYNVKESEEGKGEE
jgi:hypothetical protein